MSLLNTILMTDLSNLIVNYLLPKDKSHTLSDIIRSNLPIFIHDIIRAREGSLEVEGSLEGPLQSHIVINKTALYDAVSYGQYQLTKWLYTNHSINCYSNYCVMYAIQENQLKILRWLLKTNSNFSRYFDMYASALLLSYRLIDYAVKSNRLEIVRWLHFYGPKDECTTSAMAHASDNGNFKILKWLHFNRTEGCSDLALKLAASGGHLEILKWLCSVYKKEPDESVMRDAIDYRRVFIMRWLYDNYPQCCTKSHKIEILKISIDRPLALV